MKTVLGKIFVLMLFAVSTSFFAVLAQETAPVSEPSFEDDFSGRGNPERRMSDEMIEQMLNRLKEQDPAAAERLSKLRQENPEQFRPEFRKVMRDQWSKIRDNREQRGGRQWPQTPGPEQSDGHRRPHPQANDAQCGPGGQRMAEMRQKHQEYIEWLKDNYPEDANRLEEIRENNPELYMRKLMHSVRKYGPVAEASKDNPELAEALKQNIILKDKSDDILRKISKADEKEKEALTNELKEVVSQRFDLIVKRKQIQHQQLLKKLDNLKEEIKNSEAEVDKWKAEKDQRVNERIKELLSKNEKFQWD